MNERDFHGTLQKVCALMFWSHRTASAFHDETAGESVDGNHHQELIFALERLNGLTREWLREIDPIGHNGKEVSEAGQRVGGSREP